MENTPLVKQRINLPFHNFDSEPEYKGIFRGIIELGEGKKSFRVAIFADVETGEEKFITMSYQIEKSIEKANAENEETVFLINFQGKTEKNGKPLNLFDIGSCTLKKYNEFYNKTKKSTAK